MFICCMRDGAERVSDTSVQQDAHIQYKINIKYSDDVTEGPF
jgi:hypothetical protein